MNLKSLKNLSTDEKVLILRTTGGLTMLQNALSDGNSLRQIAEMMGLEPKTLYRCKNQYPEISEVVAPYTRVRATQVEPVVDLSKPLNYRIICSYEDHGTYLKGAIYGEYSTPQELWDSGFIQEYFDVFGVSSYEYRTQYFDELTRKGIFKINNYTCAVYCSVMKQGKIKPQVPPTP